MDRQLLSDLLGIPVDTKVVDSVAEVVKQSIERLPSDTRLAEEVVQAFHEEDQNVRSDKV